ncbi:hypothetical protein BU17DRAFT_86967 [Hysterangium stoloniferum]|nr:hypothetical protein BU17DRAFT_86967 [Hysterangium stoloniferum]
MKLPDGGPPFFYSASHLILPRDEVHSPLSTFVIIASISTYQDSYTLLGSSCYWFAGMFVKMAQECFPVKQTIGNGNIAGRYKGIKVFVPEPKAMCDMSLYKTKRNEEGSSVNYIIEAVLVITEQRMLSELVPPSQQGGLLPVAGIEIVTSPENRRPTNPTFILYLSRD